MDRRLAAGVALVVALVALALIWILRPTPHAEPTPAADEAAAPAGPAAPELVPVPAAQASREQAPAAEPVADTQPTPDPALAILRGRCVRAEDGAPLEGCSVRFSGRPANSGRMALHGPVEWTEPDPLVTGPDGRFELAFVPPPPYQHSLDVSCPGRVPRTARWGAFQPGQVEDLGDVALALGYLVEGQVVDTTGTPVSEVSVSLGGLPLPILGDMAASDSRHGRCDAGGWFRIETPIPPGTWSLSAGARGLKLVEPDRVTVREGFGAEPVRVVVRRMPSISGVVVDETGAGVSRAYVRAELHRGSGRMAAASTRQDGSFTIFAVDEELHPVRLTVDDPGPCEPLPEPTPEVEWGATDVRIELVRALSFELEVVERESGEPVEDFAVVCHVVDARSSREREARLGGNHPRGRVTVDRVRRGTNLLEVRPQDPALAPSEPLVFEAVAAPLAPIRVELVRMLPRVVQVRTADGEPVEGSRVELAKVGTRAFDAECLVLDRSRGQMTFSTNPRYRPHELLGAARTDTDGRGELFVPPDDSGLGLRVLGDSHLPLVLAQVRFPPAGALELVVSAGGAIAGRVRVEGWPRASLGLELEPAGEERTSFGGEPTVRLEGDGAFRSPSLAPGSWRLVLVLEHSFGTEGGSSGQQVVFEPELATVVVEPGRTTEVDLDASRFAPATVLGRALLDGAPAGAARAFLQRELGRGSSWVFQGFGQYVPDEDGRFEARDLPPGTYRPGLVVGDFKAGPGDRILAAETFELRAGDRLERTFAFERRRLVLRLLEPDGVTPLADAEVTVSIGLFRKRGLRTDAEGRLVLEPAPDDEVGLDVPGRELHGGPVTTPPGPREVVLDVILVPGR